MILGLETSCDETAAAVVTDDGRVLSSVVSSQADLHAKYGGVVPEIASRRHLELVTPVLEEALATAGTTPLPPLRRTSALLMLWVCHENRSRSIPKTTSRSRA